MKRIWVMLLCLGLAIPVAGAPITKSDSKEKEIPSEAIKAALEKETEFTFNNTNLNAVINTVAEQFKINIVVDRATIQTLGMDPESMPVEVKFKSTKLKTGLRAMIGQYNLSYAIVGDSLLITSEEMAIYKQLKQRISVDFNEVPLKDAAKTLGTKYGVSVVIDPRAIKAKTADNPVTLQVDDVPFESAIRLICEMADLKPSRMGNIIFITTEARADKLKGGEGLVAPPATINPFNPLPPNFPFPGMGGAGIVPPQVDIAPALPAVPQAPEVPKQIDR